MIDVKSRQVYNKLGIKIIKAFLCGVGKLVRF